RAERRLIEPTDEQRAVDAGCGRERDGGVGRVEVGPRLSWSGLSARPMQPAPFREALVEPGKEVLRGLGAFGDFIVADADLLPVRRDFRQVRGVLGLGECVALGGEIGVPQLGIALLDEVLRRRLRDLVGIVSLVLTRSETALGGPPEEQRDVTTGFLPASGCVVVTVATVDAHGEHCSGCLDPGRELQLQPGTSMWDASALHSVGAAVSSFSGSAEM